MKLFLSILALLFSLNTFVSDPVTASVVFENLTEKTSVSGVFYITETNQQIEISTLDDFKIKLPKKGKYQFRFYSEDVNAVTYYPVRITDLKNTVTIRLENKSKPIIDNNFPAYFPTEDLAKFSKDQIKERIVNGTVNFIIHGLVEPNFEISQAFKDEYGIGIIIKNCVVDPISYKTAVNNNKIIAEYLTSIFGTEWQIKLPAKPFGLQL
jgi:hypothetical protein